MSTEDDSVQHSFDGCFIDFDSGLDLPPLLPNCDEQTWADITNVYHVYRTLKQADKHYLEALNSGNGEKKQAEAYRDKLSKQQRELMRIMEHKRREVEKSQIIINFLASHYIAADASVSSENEGLSKQEQKDRRIKARLQKFGNRIQFGIDVDNTLTSSPNYLNRIPGSIQAENYMAHEQHGRKSFPDVFTRYWRGTMTMLGDIYQRIGTTVTFRPGVYEFFQRTQELNMPITIISANFRPLIDGVLSKLQFENILKSYAVEADDISATDKQTVVCETAIGDTDRALIYIGDGSSDFPATYELARQVVAFYFALEGSSLATKLEKEGLPYYTYSNFRDITNTLMRLGVLEEPPAENLVFSFSPAT